MVLFFHCFLCFHCVRGCFVLSLCLDELFMCPFWYCSNLAVKERAGCFTRNAFRLAVFCGAP